MSEAQDEPTPAGSPQARAEISPQDLKDILLLVPATLWDPPPPPNPSSATPGPSHAGEKGE